MLPLLANLVYRCNLAKEVSALCCRGPKWNWWQKSQQDTFLFMWGKRLSRQKSLNVKRIPCKWWASSRFGQSWSIFLQKKNPYQVGGWMSRFPKPPPTLQFCDPVTWGLFSEQIFIEHLQCDTHQVLNVSCTSLQVFSDSPLVPATAVVPSPLQTSTGSAQRQSGQTSLWSCIMGLLLPVSVSLKLCHWMPGRMHL